MGISTWRTDAGDDEILVGLPGQSGRLQGYDELASRGAVIDAQGTPTPCCYRPGQSGSNHLIGNTDELAGLTEVRGQRGGQHRRDRSPRRGAADPAVAQLVSLPLPQLERRFPPCRGVRRGEEHRGVGIVVDQLVAECMRLLCAHRAEATAPPVVGRCAPTDASTTRRQGATPSPMAASNVDNSCGRLLATMWFDSIS